MTVSGLSVTGVTVFTQSPTSAPTTSVYTDAIVGAGRGFAYFYKVGFEGAYRDGPWPALSLVESAFGVQWVGDDGCEPWEVSGATSPSSDTNVTAKVVTMAEHLPCAAGQPEVQALVANADSALGGSFDVYLGGLGPVTVCR